MSELSETFTPKKSVWLVVRTFGGEDLVDVVAVLSTRRQAEKRIAELNIDPNRDPDTRLWCEERELE